ncbi:MAG: DUF92 domain-containing protein [Candidatus Marsarchaeota archaeon]|nr:DUF92 domain-containing protein [Candidatus Marsarchaeota archaeon]
MKTFFTLDIKGTILAIIMALIMLVFGILTSNFALGLFYICVMAYFLILSAIVTETKRVYKKSIKLYQKSRGIYNVLANGLMPFIIVVLIFVFNPSIMLLVAFIASVAAVTADKFSSEIGVINGRPFSIITFKRIEKGVSGGISLLGTIAGFVGSLLISFSVFLLPLLNFNLSANILIFLFFIVLISGFAGTIIDSFLGYFEENGIGNKFTTNFICSLAGALIALLMVLILI